MKVVVPVFAIVAIFFCSCEKTISFTPASESAKLVVEATIENNQYPIVYLTTSLDLFSRISFEKLEQAFVHDADITISNDNASQRLKEYSYEISGHSFSYYTVDSLQPNGLFKGELGKAYSLKIISNGVEYTSTTTIPWLAKKVSSLYYETNVDKKDSTKVSLFGRFDDPPGLGNYIRYFTKTNGEPFYPGLNSVFDDQVIDGKTYSIQIPKGVDRNADIDFDTYGFFHKGDTVTVKFCNIDKATFDFWRTMEYSYSSIGNPFSSPTKVIGNISNGALGYFGGYAVQYSGIVIPE